MLIDLEIVEISLLLVNYFEGILSEDIGAVGKWLGILYYAAP